MFFTNKTYAGLKLIALITLPCLSTLCFLSSYVWNLPATKFIIGLNSCVGFLLGVLIVKSSSLYKSSNDDYDGQMYIIIPEEGPKVFTLELNGDPEKLSEQESVLFKVTPNREQ